MKYGVAAAGPPAPASGCASTRTRVATPPSHSVILYMYICIYCIYIYIHILYNIYIYICMYCIDCIDCIDCTDCINCIDCIDCIIYIVYMINNIYIYVVYNHIALFVNNWSHSLVHVQHVSVACSISPFVFRKEPAFLVRIPNLQELKKKILTYQSNTVSCSNQYCLYSYVILTNKQYIYI